jgi:general secretion pathway protein D
MKVYLHARPPGGVLPGRVKCLSKVLICLGLSFCFQVVVLAAQSAQDLAKAADREARRGDTLQAFLLYSRAAALDPSNPQYQLRKHELEAKPDFLRADEPEAEEKAPTSADYIDPDPAVDKSDTRVPLPAAALKGSPVKKSFDVRGDARTVFEQVAGAFGIQVVFEADYPAGAPFRFRLDSAGFADAFRTLELLSNSFMVPVNEHLALVVRDTPQKRTEVGPAMSVTIPIPERLSVQDAQEIVTAVQQTMEIRRASVDALKRTVLLRDGVSKVLAAKLLFAQLSKLRPQVSVEVQVLSVSKNSSLSYGLNLPTSASVVNFSSFLQNSPAALLGGFTNFLAFGGGATLLGLGVSNASIFAMVSRSSADTVLKAEIVSIDGQKATLHIGDRYPIITSQYVGSTVGTVGTVYAPPPTITFEDLGLVLNVTPTVHKDDEVSLEIDAEYKLLGAGSSNGIPVVSSSKYQGKVRLENGQLAVIAGLMSKSHSNTKSGIPGISQLPWIGRFLRNNTVSDTSSNFLIVLRPHLLSLPPWDDVNPTLWVGTDSKPLSVY